MCSILGILELQTDPAELCQLDCLRANKSMAAWGVEARVPFLTANFSTWPWLSTHSTRCRVGARSRSNNLAPFHDPEPETFSGTGANRVSERIGPRPMARIWRALDCGLPVLE